MLYIIKRLALGICLIALTSAILLFADRGRPRQPARGSTRAAHRDSAARQHRRSSTTACAACWTRWRSAAIATASGSSITRLNAQGDMPTGIAMAQQVDRRRLRPRDHVEHAVDAGGRQQQPRGQGPARLHAGRRPLGVGRRPRSRAIRSAHPPYMAGQGSFPPVDTAFELARTDAARHCKRIGVGVEPGRDQLAACSSRRAARWRRRWTSTLLEANVDTTSAVDRRDQLAHRRATRRRSGSAATTP